MLTENNLRYAWDTIAIESSARICADALSTSPGTRYGTTNPIQSPRVDVESSSVVMYTMFGEPFTFGDREFAASPEDFDFAKMFMSLTENLLEEVWRPLWRACPVRISADKISGQVEDASGDFGRRWACWCHSRSGRTKEWEG
jgi:hypothetical protein